MAKQNPEKLPERETLESQPDTLGLDAAGLDGKVIFNGVDRSLARGVSPFDEENGGPGANSGIADDPYLGGATGTADDVGMHIEEGFSLGYDTAPDLDVLDIDGDIGNSVEGGYLTLADAANDKEVSAPVTGIQSALGVPVSEANTPHSSGQGSIEQVSGGEAGYGFEGNDSDTDLHESAS